MAKFKRVMLSLDDEIDQLISEKANQLKQAMGDDVNRSDLVRRAVEAFDPKAYARAEFERRMERLAA